MLTGIKLGKAKMNKSTPKPRSPSASRNLPRLTLGSLRLAIYSRSSTDVRRLFTYGLAAPLSAREEDGSPVISCKAALVLSRHGGSPRPAQTSRIRLDYDDDGILVRLASRLESPGEAQGVKLRPADHSRHLPKGEEGNKSDAHDERGGQPFSNRSATDHRKGLGQALAVPQPNENLFDYVGGKQQPGEGHRFVGDRVDKRLIFEFVGKPKSFGEKNYLRQHQSIYQSHAVESVAYVVRAQHHPCVEREQTENDKQIGENADEALRFIEGCGFQIAFRRTAGIGGSAGS